MWVIWLGFFTPYYFFAVAALFAHIGCALFWNIGGGAATKSHIALFASIGIGLCLAMLIVMALAGYLYEVVIPQEYLNTYLQ